MIRRLKFVSIPTADQDRALSFWTEKVGLRIVTDRQMGPGARWIELAIPGAETGLVLFTPEGHEERIGSLFNGAFACDDVEHSFRQLKGRGVEFEEEPKAQPWGMVAVFRDCDGNKFVLSGK